MFSADLRDDLKLIVSGVLSLSALAAVLIGSSHVGDPFTRIGDDFSSAHFLHGSTVMEHFI